MDSSNGMYLRPRTISEALTALAVRPFTVLAGGTDFYAARSGQTITEPLLDITAIPQLRTLGDEGVHWRLGACVTWSQLVRASLPAQFCGLQAAAREIGGVQVQNMGTVAGNICNASPAADGIPALMALDAQIEISSLTGTRTVPLSGFVLGPRKTVLLSNELVTSILVPKRQGARSSFIKLGHRRYLVISIAMVAVVIDIDATGVISYAGIAVGACSAVAQRLSTLEQKLLGRPASRGLSALLETADLAALTPIDDVRASAAYRLDVALTLLKRAIEEALHE